MKRLLAAAGFAALLYASQANAANHVLNLTADFGDLVTSQFVAGGNLYDTGTLALEGFDPFVFEDGDTVEATITITGGPFAIGLHHEIFFGLDFFNSLGIDPVGDPGQQPLSPQINGAFSFDGGPDIPSGCANCVHIIHGIGDGSLSFTTLTANATVTFLAEPYSVDRIQLSYQAANPVPEPATWALMILGFGGAGAILRRRTPGAHATV